MQPQRLLIVDDEKDMLEGLQRVLAYELEGVSVTVSDDPETVMADIQQQCHDLVLLDVRMPEVDGMALLEAFGRCEPPPTVIMMTAYGDIETAVTAIKQGAYDFITKPFEIPDLLRVLRKGLERSRLIGENLTLRRQVSEKAAFTHFLGQSQPVRRLYQAIKSLANSDYAVLIRGESGTGKELVARAIHGLSGRSSRDLVAVNCPAIPEHLLESELFGHEKGAFTGAMAYHKGLFEQAHGASLLLDEIGDIPVSVQTKLLRVLQEREIRPLGGTHDFRVDVRILSTTNQNLEEKIKDRTFREDLYYRLNVVSVFTPALREMREDIPLLVQHFTRQVCDELGCASKRIAPEVMNRLVRREWPGNARELQNFVRRLVLFTPETEIDRDALAAVAEEPDRAAGITPFPGGIEEIRPYLDEKERLIDAFTDQYVDQLLRKTQGNVSKAARLSGLSRQALQKMLNRKGIDPETYRES
ncbi:sigma-54-dependent transcriptional regulator [Desulfatitalea alkaliphila]|uniref:Sigma-54 dependent transcriptional regulator n=1 Tax=Desulfatitalea alkaliphila TaxID=2929485 RepID=A0AA41UHE8_9BACT|nr:sigma-54 dependent transcriptional regulator [Desulfatitalea alkaliphila]MCJ8498959.1 sigma-54 dependent transcriptional regulator [Desulfatitalea alkaliphila]